MTGERCLFCGGDASEPGHLQHCDGRQGALEDAPHFDGSTYEPDADHARLTNQLALVRGVMRDGRWRTLEEISTVTGAPPASISARLRDLRKEKFGAYIVMRRARGERPRGLFEYRVEQADDTGRNDSLARRHLSVLPRAATG